MAMVSLILLNVLIAQLSYTYSEAKSNAKLQYAIDRIVTVTRIEYSRFSRFVSGFKAINSQDFADCLIYLSAFLSLLDTYSNQ